MMFAFTFIYYKYKSGASKMASSEWKTFKLLSRPEHIKLIQYMNIQTHTKPFLLIKQVELFTDAEMNKERFQTFQLTLYTILYHSSH